MKANIDIDHEWSLVSAKRKRRRLLIAAAGMLLVAFISYFYLANGDGTQVTQYRFAEVQREDLTVTVTATGTVQPVNQVDVGTEISGTIRTVNVDTNDKVSSGQLIAALDTDLLLGQFRQSQAALVAAQATVQESEATLAEKTREFNRLKSVKISSEGRLPSDRDFDAAEAAAKIAEASLLNAKARVEGARASMLIDETNLKKAEIRSPINGVVLVRNVEPGQTVAASLQTPVLFTLAENLGQMELEVAVDEADVGQVKQGQSATFAVDAYPGKVFDAEVNQIHFASQTVDGVVTYKTVLGFDNRDHLLRPGMTATAEIVVARQEKVLQVPNVALRFEPPNLAKTSNQPKASILASLLPRPPMSRRPAKRDTEKKSGPQVWILKNDKPSAIDLVIGASDGKSTEVISGDITEGTPVIIDVLAATEG